MTPNCTHQSSQNETIMAHSELFILLLFISFTWSVFCWLFVAATMPSMIDFHRTLIYCIYCQQQSFIRALYSNSSNQLLLVYINEFVAVSFILHARCRRTQNFSNWINQAIVCGTDSQSYCGWTRQWCRDMICMRLQLHTVQLVQFAIWTAARKMCSLFVSHSAKTAHAGNSFY